jgi:hypothetical protein
MRGGDELVTDRNGLNEAWTPEPVPVLPCDRRRRRFWRRRSVIIALVAIALLLIFGGDAMAHSIMHATGGGCGGG